MTGRPNTHDPSSIECHQPPGSGQLQKGCLVAGFQEFDHYDFREMFGGTVVRSRRELTAFGSGGKLATLPPFTTQ